MGKHTRGHDFYDYKYPCGYIYGDFMIFYMHINFIKFSYHNDITAFRKRQLISFTKFQSPKINNRINMQWGIFIDAYIRKLYIKFRSIQCCSFWEEEAGKIVDDDCHRRHRRHQAMPIAYGLSASKLKSKESNSKPWRRERRWGSNIFRCCSPWGCLTATSLSAARCHPIYGKKLKWQNNTSNMKYNKSRLSICPKLCF